VSVAGLRLRGLTVRHGASEVLHGVDLEVEEGEFLVLLGPSGCGKSTLLHAIAGLVEVAAGSVEIGGEAMTGADPADRNIGMVFQSYALYPTMTVERNLSFGLRVRGMARAEVAQRVSRVARMLQLEDLLRRRPAELSGGQRQRVAIGRALARDARVFLLDEPLSNLDAQLRAELRRELKLLHARLGATMVYVTHDQAEAMTLATRIVILDRGRIQQVGEPGEVYARPANRFVAGFLGSPGMSLVAGRLEGADGMPVFAGERIRVPLAGYSFASAMPAAGAELELGLRPEHVTLDAQAPTRARVVLVEPLGSHQVVWVESGADRLCAVAEAGARWRPGEETGLRIDAGAVSLFARGDGRRL